MKTAALFVLAALGLAACGGSSDPAPQEPPPTPITGDWMCYLPGHLDDPYAFQAGYGVHVSLQTAREFWTTVQPSGTYEGSWDGGGVGDWGYLRGDWDGTSITMQERVASAGSRSAPSTRARTPPERERSPSTPCPRSSASTSRPRRCSPAGSTRASSSYGQRLVLGQGRNQLPLHHAVHDRHRAAGHPRARLRLIEVCWESVRARSCPQGSAAEKDACTDALDARSGSHRASHFNRSHAAEHATATTSVPHASRWRRARSRGCRNSMRGHIHRA